MRILSWNVNGLRAVVKKGFFDWLNSEAPDVVCLQEIKARTEDLDESILNPEGYYATWNPAKRKGYSGVAVFTKKKPKSVHLGIGIERFDIEGRVIRIEFKDFDLLNVYFPNGTSGSERLEYKMEFYDAFLDHCEQLRVEGRELVITGDVNTAHKAIDLKNPKAKWPYPALTTYHRNDHTLRTERWRYIRYANGDEELYDHAKDSHEWDNLAQDKKFADVLKRFRGQLPKVNAPDSPTR